MRYEIRVEQMVKGTITMTFNVDCEPNELELIKEELVEDLNNGDFQDTDKVEISETIWDDYWQDQNAKKPVIISTERI